MAENGNLKIVAELDKAVTHNNLKEDLQQIITDINSESSRPRVTVGIDFVKTRNSIESDLNKIIQEVNIKPIKIDTLGGGLKGNGGGDGLLDYIAAVITRLRILTTTASDAFSIFSNKG